MKQISLAVAAFVSAVTFPSPAQSAPDLYDIAIYGGTSAGISAAVQASRMGCRAVVIAPEGRIGGLTTGGLGQTDIGNKSAIGGIAREFYRAVKAHYADDTSWNYERREDYKKNHPKIKNWEADFWREDAMWTFEPKVALAILEGWVKRDELTIVRGERLDRGGFGVEKAEGKIVAIRMESGRRFAAKMFIDATYEGDLMAAAGVSYTVGRESNSVYGETLNGCQPFVPSANHHNFKPGVSAYVKPGDPKSGILPGIEPGPIEPPGTGDARVQAYCFRSCLTDVPENRIPFKKPAGYNERDYELLFRNLEAGEGIGVIGNARQPNRKTDTNNNLGTSTDFIGQNWSYAEAPYADRERIVAAHLRYQQGFFWTLANHPRVPQAVRSFASKSGTCKDEYLDGFGDGWQRQLYVREARRMVGDFVMTEHHCTHAQTAPRPIALAAYTMDSHHVRRYVAEGGLVRNEGNVEVGVRKGPYPIDYGAILPKKAECGNLFVPVCLSASHIAYGSIRMEPVFFALGQSAATAAALAIEAGCAAQDLDYPRLAARLIADGQRIEAVRRQPVKVSFARGKWNPADFFPAKSWRWDYLGTFDQRDDAIVNHCPDVPGDEVYRKHHDAVYAALMHRSRFEIGTRVSSTMSFDHRMAPIVVLAPFLVPDAKTGAAEFRDHWEVCLYDGGINVWHHFFVNGRQRWHKAASLLLPKAAEFRANERYDLQVAVAYNKNGRKEMKVACGGYTLSYVDDRLPDTFLVGIIACEGRNFFYDFRVERCP